MRKAAKHGVDQNVDEKPGVQTALEKHGDSLCNRLQGCGSHHISEQLDEVCVCRIAADGECPLPDAVKKRLAAADIRRRASSNNKELPVFGGRRISKNRCGDIALTALGMPAREIYRRGGADRAHRKMNGAA